MAGLGALKKSSCKQLQGHLRSLKRQCIDAREGVTNTLHFLSFLLHAHASVQTPVNSILVKF